MVKGVISLKIIRGGLEKESETPTLNKLAKTTLTMADNNDESEQQNSNEINLSDLSDEQKEALTSHPEVRKMLEYEDTSIPQIAGMLRNLTEVEPSDDFLTADANPETTYEILIHGIAEKHGRITRSTIHKVLSGFVTEYESVQQ